MSPAWYEFEGFYDIDDLERLEALSAYSPPPSFEEAFSRLKHGTDRVIAEAAYADFLAYHQPNGPVL